MPRAAGGADSVAVAGTAAGALLVAWRETILEWCERDTCFDRVLVAAAAPGAPFGPAQLVSPLGTRTDRVVGAVAEDGRRIVAWHGAGDDAFAPNALAVAFGDATPDRPARSDRRAPRACARSPPASAPARCASGCAPANPSPPTPPATCEGYDPRARPYWRS